MPGKVVQVLVKEGDTVAKGDPLAVLSAMKMETAISAPTDGVVSRVAVAVNDEVCACFFSPVSTPVKSCG